MAKVMATAMISPGRRATDAARAKQPAQREVSHGQGLFETDNYAHQETQRPDRADVMDSIS